MHKVVLVALMSVGATLYVNGAALASSSGPVKPSPSVRPVAKTVAATPAAPAPKLYTVQPGDSLSGIATTEVLSSWQPLWDANPALTDPDVIYPDQQLTVPTSPTTPRPLPEGYVSTADSQVASGGSAGGGSSAARVGQTATGRAVSAAPNYAAGAGGILARIRQRESGGNYADNTGNGYYGAYQFTLSTWKGVGGQGLPSNASPAEQDMRAQMLYNERGCAPWPNTCY